jgi:hypothetical protein
LTMNTNHEFSCNAMLYSLLLPTPFQPHTISFSTLFSNTLSPYSFLHVSHPFSTLV